MIINNIQGVVNDVSGELYSRCSCWDVQFGVVVAWNLTVGQEFDAVFLMAMSYATQPLPEADVEVDEFKMQYSVNKPPQVQNDTIVLANRYCSAALAVILC